jgi:hypothetical protein
MTQQHPITPPPVLIEGWVSDFFGAPLTPGEGSIDLATRAAQWGADQELEACCEWLDGVGDLALQLRADRRPKPPSLKKQALAALSEIEDRHAGPTIQEELIRRALEQLPDYS